MPIDDSDYGASDAQRALLRRARAMFDLLGDDPRFTYYGRTVGLSDPQAGTLDQLFALASLQGSTLSAQVEPEDIDTLIEAITARGFKPVNYARWVVDDPDLSTARRIAADRPLPDDLTCHQIGPDTPASLIRSFAELCLGVGVLPPSLDALTGELRPFLALVAVEPSGRVVSVAAAAAILHPDHPRAAECWWGMLATHPDRRGESLSLILGAQVMLHFHDRHGTTRFFTGVERGNAASEAVCHRIGMAPDGTATLGLADPGLLPGGRMTK